MNVLDGCQSTDAKVHCPRPPISIPLGNKKEHASKFRQLHDTQRWRNHLLIPAWGCQLCANRLLKLPPKEFYVFACLFYLIFPNYIGEINLKFWGIWLELCYQINVQTHKSGQWPQEVTCCLTAYLYNLFDPDTIPQLSPFFTHFPGQVHSLYWDLLHCVKMQRFLHPKQDKNRQQ